VLVLLSLLMVTNLVTLGVLAWYVLRPGERPRPDVEVARALSNGGPRRVITVEIRNPIELAGSRGWLARVAGSLAPGTTHRVVHDMVLKSLRRGLAEQQVDADVRLHVIEPCVDLVKPDQPG
jgi:hypothetical protein